MPRHLERRRSMGQLAAAVAGAAAAAVGCIAGSATRADAGVMIDLRAVNVNGHPLSSGSTAKQVEVLPGDVVTIDLFAVVNGTNGVNDEGFQGVTGVFRSSTAGLLGDLVSSTAPAFSSLGAQQGSQIDADSDGDLDIGVGPNTPTANSNTVFSARNASMNTNGAVVGSDSEEWQIGTLTFAVSANAMPGEQTILDFLNRKNNSGSNNLQYGIWVEDTSTNPPGNRNPTNALVDHSGLAVIAVPEPSALAVMGLASLGLLARRRQKQSQV